MMRNKTKKLLSLLLTAALLLGAAPLTALDLKLPDLSGLFSFAQTLAPQAKASDYLTYGYCGDTSDGKDGTDIYWELDENGVLTLTGTGPMGSTPNQNDNRVTSLTVGEGITAIADNAFSNCQNLSNVTLASSVLTIGEAAFYNDTNLITADLGGCKTIGIRAFSKNSKLKTVYFSQCETVGNQAFSGDSSLQTIDFSNVKYIGANAFTDCSALKTVHLNSCIEIGNSAFYSCTKISDILFSENLISIGDSAFNDAFNKGWHSQPYNISLVFPDSLQTIGTFAFYNGSDIVSVSFGSGLLSIGTNAFYGCRPAGAIIVPDACTAVGSDAFSGNTITSLYLGENIVSYGGCTNLTKLESITVSENNQYYASYDGVLYKKDFSEIIQVTKRTTLNLPAAFPMQSGRFLAKWKNIAYVNVDENNASYRSFNGIIYSKNGKKVITCPPAYSGTATIAEGTTSIGNAAFFQCKSISGVILPQTLVTIGSQAFYNSSISEIDIPGSVTYIYGSAFHTSGLSSVVFHEGLQYIGEFAFASTHITTIALPDTLQQINYNAFSNCSDLETVTFGTGLTSIGQGAFNNCSQLTGDIVFPDQCTTVGTGAFALTSVTSFYLGASLSSFDTSYYLNSLQRIDVSEENDSYSSYDGVLYSKGFTKLILSPARSVLNLPAEFSLQDGNFLKTYVTFSQINVDPENENYSSIDGVLYSKNGKTLIACPRQFTGTLSVADGTEEIGEYAAYYCEKIDNVVFPDSLKKIGARSFDTCREITQIEFPDSVTDIGSRAFAATGIEKVVVGTGLKKVDIGYSGIWIFSEMTLSEATQNFVFGDSPVNVSYFYAPNRYMSISGYGLAMPEDDNSVVCAYCGSPAHEMAVKRQFRFDSLGHTYLGWYTVTPATFESEGLERRDCAYCDGYEERVIPKLERDTFTATFMADGRVVGYVDFQKGATSVEAPAVPAKDRYTGRWEDYTLADADITINAVYTLIQSGDASEIETDSSATLYQETDDVLFRMSAYSAARTVKSVVSQAVPLDIVLVVDQSGSMDETLGGNVKKVDALKAAAHEFIDVVAENAALTGADHRIAIAGFGLAGNYDGYQTNENTELLTSSRGIVPFAEITPADYGAALFSISDKDALDDAVDAIEARGATAADLGLEMAKGVFANTDSEGRDRIVVFMTDGAPTYKSSFQSAVANSAVANAQLLKNAYGALVYSVGVFSNADAQNINIQRFMQAVSSNYPNARSYTNPGAAEANSFFTTVRNTDALSGVFRTITTESLSHTASFDNVTLIKTLSRYVTLTDPQEQTLRVNAIRQYGIDNDQITVTRNEDGTTTIRLDGLTPYEVEKDGVCSYEVSFEFFASLNENAVAEGDYTVDNEDSGIMLGDAVGYEATFATNSITLSAAKTRYLFTINGELYEIAEGSTVSDAVPETDFSPDWLFSGWNTEGVNSVNGVIIDATLVKAPRTVIWHTADGDVTQYYTEGALIIPPEVADRADGSKFLSWDKSLPTVMLDEDLEFTAVYGEHVHKYVSATEQAATCTEDGLIRFTCVCGDTYTQTVEAAGHDYEAITPSTEQDASRCTFVCNNCGQRYEYALDYQVTVVMNGGKNVSFEFALTDDDLNVGFEPDGSVAISVPLSEFQTTAHSVHVTRTVNGHKERVPARLEDGFVVISADHFTPYEIDFVFACAESGEHDWGEGEVTKEPTCKEEGVRHFVCSICLDEKDEPIPADDENHADYGTEIVNAAAAACYRDGYTGDTVCKGCGHMFEQGEVISKTTVPHAWDEGTVTVKPTCKSPGTMLYRCTVKSCGATEEREMPVDPDAHVYTVTVVEPTCATEGFTVYTCTLCGDSFTADPTPVVNHVDNNGDGLCDYGCGTALGGAEQESNCVCGKYHTGPMAGFIIFFHKVIYFFRNLFGNR